MTRSSSSVERPILRLVLMALMGLALASRLALGATAPIGAADDTAHSTGALAKLQAAMILCHTGNGHSSVPPVPKAPLPTDLLLFDQADNAHALAGNAATTPLLTLNWSAVAFLPIHAADRPALWRPVGPARGPPTII